MKLSLSYRQYFEKSFLANWPYLLGEDIREYYTGCWYGPAGICLLSSHYNYNNLMDFRLQSCPPTEPPAQECISPRTRTSLREPRVVRTPKSPSVVIRHTFYERILLPAHFSLGTWSGNNVIESSVMCSSS